jgi:hypothetical protein
LSQPWNPISIQHPPDDNAGQDFPWSKSYCVMPNVDAVQAQQHFPKSALQQQMETLIRPGCTYKDYYGTLTIRHYRVPDTQRVTNMMVGHKIA